MTHQLEHALRAIGYHLANLSKGYSEPAAKEVMVGLGDAACRTADQLQQEREQREAALQVDGGVRYNPKGKP